MFQHNLLGVFFDTVVDGECSSEGEGQVPQGRTDLIELKQKIPG